MEMSKRLRPLVDYGLALFMIALAFVLTLLIPAVFGANPFLLFFAAVTLAAWYGGFGPGIAASVLSLVIVKAVFLRPADLPLINGVDIGRITAFLLVTGVVGALHLQRKRTLDALRRSHDQLDIYLRDMANGVMVQDQSGKLIYANYEAAKTMGFVSAEAMLQASADQVLQPYEIYDEFGEPMPATSLPGRLALLGMRYPETVLRVRFKDTGKERWAFDKARPVFDEQGQVQASISLFLDITELKETQQALAEQREQLQVTLHSIGDAVIATDADGKVTFVNPVAASLTGWSEAAALEKPITEVVHVVAGQSRQEVQNPALRVLNEGSQVRETDGLILVSKSGAERPVGLTGAPIRDRQNHLIGTVLVIWDMTERLLAEARLRARIHQQEVVATLGLSALSDGDLPTLMQEVAEETAQTLQVDFGELLELLPGAKTMLLRAGFGWTEGRVGHTVVDVGADSHGGFTLLANEPVIVEDYSTETRFSRSLLLREHNVVSGMSVIIAGDPTPWGALGVHTRERRVFTKDDIHFLQAMANLLASSIRRENAEYAEREQRTYAEALRDTAEALSGTLDLAQVLNRILENVERVVRPDSVDIMLIEGDQARVVGSQGYERHDMDKAILNVQLPLKTTRTLREIVSSGQPMVVRDVSSYPDWVSVPGMEWVASYVGVPLVIQGQVKGVLDLCSEQQDFFTPERVRRLQSFAAQASVAIRNAQLYGEARDSGDSDSLSA